MEFLNETIYNKANLDMLTRVAGYTVKKRQTMRNRMICFLIGATGLILGLTGPFENQMITSLCQVYGFIFAFAGVFWFQVQCFPNFAAARPAQHFTLEFTENYFGAPEAFEPFTYDQLILLVEGPRSVLIFWDEQHGMILDKDGFSKGDPTDFVRFLEEKTGLTTLIM